MSFEFVNMTAENPRHDEATSTRIRAQVMRNFRRRELALRRQRTRSSTRSSRHGDESENERSGNESLHSAETALPFELINRSIHAYRSWLASYHHPEHTATTIATAPWRSSNLPMMLNAQCLEAIAHLDAIQQSRYPFTDVQKTTIKVNLLRQAHESLEEQGTALQDEIVAALACLTTYELSTRSNEASIHLHGLADCLLLRDAEQPAFKQDTTTFLEVVDLLHALMFKAKPLYTKSTASLVGAGSRTTERASSKRRQDRSDVSLDSAFASWHSSLLQATLLASSQQNKAAMVRMGTLAAQIHIAATNTVPMDPSTMLSHCETLYRDISAAPDAMWSGHTGLHIRILLTALHSCSSRRSWYFAHLSRALYNVTLTDWEWVKDIILEFIEMKCFKELSIAEL